MTGSSFVTDLVDPAVATAAAAVFGARLATASRYADTLAGAGVQRGLLGPREVPRLWQRHLLNCVALADFIPRDARVVDVGSGAGLPGLVLALARDDLRLDLVEPMLRRSTFLAETVTELGLDAMVRVHRGRAEDLAIRDAVGGADSVVSRAVAPLDRLMTWCLPLLAPGAYALALKGAGAGDEVAEQRGRVAAVGGSDPEVLDVYDQSGGRLATVVRVQRVPNRAFRSDRRKRGA